MANDAREHRITKLKRLLIERVTSIVEVGVLKTDKDSGETYVADGSDKDLRLALDLVKTFHAEAPKEIAETHTGPLSDALKRFVDRQPARPDA